MSEPLDGLEALGIGVSDPDTGLEGLRTLPGLSDEARCVLELVAVPLAAGVKQREIAATATRRGSSPAGWTRSAANSSPSVPTTATRPKAPGAQRTSGRRRPTHGSARPTAAAGRSERDSGSVGRPGQRRTSDRRGTLTRSPNFSSAEGRSMRPSLLSVRRVVELSWQMRKLGWITA